MTLSEIITGAVEDIIECYQHHADADVTYDSDGKEVTINLSDKGEVRLREIIAETIQKWMTQKVYPMLDEKPKEEGE